MAPMTQDVLNMFYRLDAHHKIAAGKIYHHCESFACSEETSNK